MGTLPVFGSSFDARARSLPLRVGSEGIIALRSLNSSMRQKAGVMRQFPTFYKAHHLALALRMSAAGVRLRVRMGYMTPDAVTADGTALWSPDGVERELWSEASLKCRALAAGIRNGDTRVFLQRRGPSRDPVQLELGA